MPIFNSPPRFAVPGLACADLYQVFWTIEDIGLADSTDPVRLKVR
jgi:hypothetical protein